MKDWKRKLKNIFNLKGEEKSQRIIDNDPYDMMEKRREPLTPQHRRLPPLPRRQQVRFPATFSDAEDWISTCQPTIDQTLQVIERYPELLKQKACERLREFGAKNKIKCRNRAHKSTNAFIERINAGDENRETCKVQKPQTDTEDKILLVPEILVSQAEEDDLLFLGNQPRRVFVCGYVDNDLWHHLLVDLCKKYSIRCLSPSGYPECNRWLSETDVFLFLMDDTSVGGYPYQDQLRLAVVLDLNIVYVRDLGFELKMEHSSENINSEDSRSTHTHLQDKVPLYRETPRVTKGLHPNIPIQRLKSLPLDSVAVDIDSDEESQLLHDLYGKISPPPYRHTRCTIKKTSECHHTHSRPEVDVTKITEIEYGRALVYHHLYHSRCLDRIISAINSQGLNLIGRSTPMTNSRHSLLPPFSNYSTYSGFSSDSAVGDMYHPMTPEPIDPELEHDTVLEHEQSFDKLPNRSELSSPSETIFLVCPADGDEKPKVFHWPKDVEEEVITNSPSIDSFGFQDIDLSMRINEIHLFED